MGLLSRPLEFLCPHLLTLRICYENMNESIAKRKMEKILSLVDSAASGKRLRITLTKEEDDALVQHNEYCYAGGPVEYVAWLNTDDKDKDISLSGEHVTEGTAGIISVKVPNPEFEGQTKVSKVGLDVEVIDTERQGEDESKAMGSEVAMPMADLWDDLPNDLISYIVAIIPCCRAERQAVSHVNRHWRRVIQLELHVPAALPWLVIPSSTAPVFHTSRRDGRWHDIKISDDLRQNARICGSSEGGWFVLALKEPHRHQLFNFNSGDILPLPKEMLINGELKAVTLKAAVLSQVPAPPYTYTVAGIVQSQESCVYLAVCNHLSLQWECVTSVPEDLTIQDILHFRDTFYVLISDEDVVTLVMEDQKYDLRYLHVRERPAHWIESMMYTTMQRYLCESGGDIYMVVKCLRDITLEARVFQLNIDSVTLLPNLDDEDMIVNDEQASWVDMSESKELDGRVFFVGQASSRSFGTSEYGRVHFLDDHHAEAAPGVYLREDMGIVSLLDQMVENFPPVGNAPLPPPTSDREPSAWLLH